MIASAAYYFPFTDMLPHRLIRIAVLIHRIILLSLPPDQATDLPEIDSDRFPADAETSGILKKVEASFIQDRSELKRILADFSGWVEQAGDPSYLRLLKGVFGKPAENQETGSRLMSHIRRGKFPDPYRDPERAAQIFLHIAQRLDRQQSEIDHLMAGVHQKESRLGSLLGVTPLESEDDSGKNDMEIPPDMFDVNPGKESKTELMAERLTAWGQFYQRFGEPGVPLVTDHPEAISLLDLSLSKFYGAPNLDTGRTTEVLEPFLSVDVPDPIGMGAADVKDILDLRSGPDALYDVIDRIGSHVWKAEDIPELRSDILRLAPPRNMEAGRLKANGYLLPGHDLKDAFLQAVGLKQVSERSDVYCGPVFEIVRS
jgi:hypothetical protein